MQSEARKMLVLLLACRCAIMKHTRQGDTEVFTLLVTTRETAMAVFPTSPTCSTDTVISSVMSVYCIAQYWVTMEHCLMESSNPLPILN